jgi:hypothetical protein
MLFVTARKVSGEARKALTNKDEGLALQLTAHKYAYLYSFKHTL